MAKTAAKLGLPDVGPPRFDSLDGVRSGLADVGYLADDSISGVVYLADRLSKPVLVEGPAGTGKTQLAKSVAELAGARLIRLQCYEGLDESKALYEWNYRKQLLRIQAGGPGETESGGASWAKGAHSPTWKELEEDIFSEEFLLARPLLEAIRSTDPVVLLVDEVDRVELETEALLLEILSEYQVSIPELGTVRATRLPMVFLTSNNTRELSEALKRRCLYLHIDYPDLDREREIVRSRVPGITEELADQVARIVRSLRTLELRKPPSVSETLDWARTLVILGIDTIDAAGARDTLHILLKYQTDIERAAKELLSPADVGTGLMLDLLSGFVTELRRAGLPVSLTEHLDAAEAVHHIPLEDREALKYALAATLVKSSSHWRAFETAFEVFFAVRTGGHGTAGELDADGNEIGENADGAGRGRGRHAGPGTVPARRRRRRGDDARGAGRDALQVPALRRRRPHERRGAGCGRPLRRHGARATGRRHVLPLPDAAEPRPRRRPGQTDEPGPGRGGGGA